LFLVQLAEATEDRVNKWDGGQNGEIGFSVPIQIVVRMADKSDCQMVGRASLNAEEEAEDFRQLQLAAFAIEEGGVGQQSGDGGEELRRDCLIGYIKYKEISRVRL
jgi:hypothetical protein